MNAMTRAEIRSEWNAIWNQITALESTAKCVAGSSVVRLFPSTHTPKQLAALYARLDEIFDADLKLLAAEAVAESVRAAERYRIMHTKAMECECMDYTDRRPHKRARQEQYDDMFAYRDFTPWLDLAMVSEKRALERSKRQTGAKG